MDRFQASDHGAPLLGRFELLAPLGAGGFGSVVEARDTVSGARVALKELVRTNPSVLVRFKQEFRALADLHHPNLVRLEALFEHGGRWFIAMELVEGQDLLSWTRPPTRKNAANDNALPFDEARLRAALVGLTRGLRALHDAGFLHRDLKPSNVLVSAEGRVVLLDFGLVTGSDENVQSTQAGALGTAAYMAPEQATGAKIGPAADFYAMGVSLYEALSGRLPFESTSPIEQLLAKQNRTPAPPSSHEPRIPPDLEALCMQLLAPDPRKRPSAREILEQLGVSADEDHELAGAPAAGASATFAGREAELEQLEREFERSQTGTLRIVLLEGESGVGKTALVEELLRGLKARHADLLVLRGRCYENEQVSYKAFDGAMDELARALRKLERSECEELLPPRAVLLAQLFPVMASVTAIAQGRRSSISADPTARRLEAFRSLSELLCSLAAQRPVVIVVDDVQWADAESFRLLRALVEETPAPPVLFLFTVRPREELDREVLENLEVVRDWPATELLPIRGLPRSQAQKLAASLLGPSTPDAWLNIIAAESKGHPLFIHELVHYAASHELGAGGELSLEAALGARIRKQSRDARALLDLVALAGRPHGAQVFARALGGEDVGAPMTALLSQRLLRRRKDQQLVCTHDRVRQIVVDLIAASRLQGLHAALAAALEAEPNADPADRARHWDGAGEHTRALEAYEIAADRALEALAFAQAERLYGRALELVPSSEPARRERLLVQRAHALARRGRSAEAARLFQEAAALAQGDTKLRYRIWAAQQLVQSAQVDEGMTAARALLEELGVPLPASSREAISTLLWYRSRLALRGLEPAKRAQVSPEERLRLDAIWALNLPVSWADLLPGASLSARHLLHALNAGDPAHVARALSLEAGTRALQRPEGLASHRALLERSRALISGLDDPALDAHVRYLAGQVAFFAFDLAAARAEFEGGVQLLTERCPGEHWLLANQRQGLGVINYYSGNHARLARESNEWLREARERDDRFAITALVGLGFGFARHLMRDEPEQARKEVVDAVAPWPREPFGLAQWGELVAITNLELYRGGEAAWTWLESKRSTTDRSFLLKTRSARVMQGFLEGSSAIAAWNVLSSRRKELVGIAHKRARELGSIGVGRARADSTLLEAQCCAVQGNAEDALEHVRAAREGYATLGHYHQHPAAYLEGLLMGGEGGRAKCDAALSFFEREGWKQPERAIAMIAPAVQALTQRKAALPPRPSAVQPARFERLSSLGQGGFGTVYEALDRVTGRRVALKQLARTSPESLLRFKQEFRALSGVQHPNLVRLHMLYEHAGEWSIAMELVEGEDLSTWLRSSASTQGRRVDEARVRSAIVGITRGLMALHDAGFVHRDLTPANVRVTPEGRLVLLDFGLLDVFADELSASGSVPAGSAAYMAPEQASGQHVGPAADLYALGACLYEALTGRLPVEGASPTHVMQAKCSTVPLPPSALGVAGSPELEALVMDLLAIAPTARPSAADVLMRLGIESAARSEDASASRLNAAFVGREKELATLEAAFARAASGPLELAFIEGESGVGKSALLQELFARVRTDAEPIVLHGRCYENEQLAYKAFDHAVDELARVLRKLAPSAVEPLLPKKAALLRQLFAVLGTVKPIQAAPLRGLPAEPSARRLEAFEAFTQLLAALARERPVVLAVDDLQWADAESFRLLQALVASAARGVFVVATVRPREELTREVREQLQSSCGRYGCTRVELEGLAVGPARALAQHMLGREVPKGMLDKLVDESRGHPLLLSELVRYVERHEPTRSGAVSLDAAIAARIETLSEGEREVLELIALSGRPRPAPFFARAQESHARLERDLAGLHAHKLVRSNADHSLSCVHDRVRKVVVDMLSQARRSQLHARLASALEKEADADAAELAWHWDAAGDPALAVVAYERAADHALDTLAFARSAQLYRRALELAPNGDLGRRRRLLVQEGHALARLGKSAEAALSYGHAAEISEGAERSRLRIWATLHLLQGARVDEGMQAAHALLAELGAPLPRGGAAALRSLLWNRACIAARGLEPKPAAADIPSDERLKLEAMWELSFPITWIDMLPGVSLGVRHLRRALDLGEPSHTARALALEAGFHALQHPEREERYKPLLARSRALIASSDEPALTAYVAYMEGQAASFRCDFQAASLCFEEAARVLESRCPGEPWLLTQVRQGLLAVLFFRGQHVALARLADSWLEEAEQRDDHFARTALSTIGYGAVRHLLDDAPGGVDEELARTMAAWPTEPFSLAHVGELYGTLYAQLYRGGDGALRHLAAMRARVDRAFVLKTRFGRTLTTYLHATATLAALRDAPERERRALLKEARSAARSLLRTQIACAPAHAALVLGQCHALEGRTPEALAELSRALDTYTKLGMFQEHATRYLHGVLQSDAAGQRACAAALASIAEQGWKSPQRAVAMLAPAVDSLKTRS